MANQRRVGFEEPKFLRGGFGGDGGESSLFSRRSAGGFKETPRLPFLRGLFQDVLPPFAKRPGTGTGTGPTEGAAKAQAVPQAAPVVVPGPTEELGSLDLRRIAQEAAEAAGVDPKLLAALISAESNWNPNAVSKAGAQGLGQIMPLHGLTNPFDPQENTQYAAKFLRQLLDRYGGNVELALAAYNAGPGAVDKYGGIPPFEETQRYVPRVLGIYRGQGGD